MTEAGETALKRMCKYSDDNEARDMERLKQGGVTVVTLPAADAGAVWSEQLDKRGKPGTEVFKAFRAALPK